MHSRFETTPSSCRLSILSSLPVHRLNLGDSVAVNGSCLTVTAAHTDQTLQKTIFTADVGPETLARTRLGKLDLGTGVHLEAALCWGDPVGGHTLTGHIDTLCTVTKCEPYEAESGCWILSVHIPATYALWVIPQGSIAIAGVSLTVAKHQKNSDGSLEISSMLIPHTLKNTLLGTLKAQDEVEIEFDPLVKTIVSTVRQVQGL